MQNTIRALAVKHQLSNAEVIAVLERAFAGMLSRWYGQDVLTMLDEDALLAVAYSRDEQGNLRQRQVEPTILRRLRKGSIPQQLHNALQRLRTANEVASYRSHEKQLRWGEIVGRDPDGSLRVEIEIEDGSPIIALCPRNRVGEHERHLLTIGQRRAWHIRQVALVMLDDVPRIDARVDRVSKTLVTNLIKSHLPTSLPIHCEKRYVGKQSLVSSPCRLPQEALLATSEELREYVKVLYGKKAANVFSRS